MSAEEDQIWDRRIREREIEILKGHLENNLQYCFKQWEIHMERWRDQERDYYKGDKIIIVDRQSKSLQYIPIESVYGMCMYCKNCLCVLYAMCVCVFYFNIYYV